nr:transposase [Crateriforma conspicua]
MMPEYRRAFVTGGTYFFTVVTYQRQPTFADPTAVTLLGNVLRQCASRWPVDAIAIVLLPDHWHSIWSLPPGDDQYSKRLGWIKKELTKRWLVAGGSDQQVSTGKQRQRRRGVWQPRFWEHTIEGEMDFQSHFDYVHWNPVKHGYVKCAKDWPHTSFHRWVKQGVYPDHWGCFTKERNQTPETVSRIREAGEP